MTAAARRIAKHAEPVSHRPDGEFVPIKKAARRLGRNEAALRRDCGKLAATGMARQIRSASGQTTWHVHRSLDPRLVPRADEAVDESATEILLHATQGQRDRAAARVKMLTAYRQLLSSGATIKREIGRLLDEQESATGDRVTLRTLQRWSSDAPPTDQPKRLLAFFIDRRGGDQRSSEATGRGCHPEAWAEFERVYLHRNQWHIAKAWRHVQALAKANGWQWPGLRHVTRMCRKRIEPSRECFARHGEEIWQAKFGYKIQQDPNAWPAGDLWVSDHVELDFFVGRCIGGQWFAARPQMTSWFDWRTRKILGWWIDWTPNSDTIRYALHHAIKREGGPPRHIVIDNGKDFASYANNGITKKQRRKLTAEGKHWVEHCDGRGLFGMLGIITHFALPYNHNGKSRLERWHRTLHAEFDKEFDSYCGRKPGDVVLPKWVFKEPQRLVRIDEVRKRLPRFIDWYNDRSDHFMDDLVDEQGRKLSPAEAMNGWRQTRPIMPHPAALSMLTFRWDQQPRTVGKNGIGIRVGGQTFYYGQDAMELRALQGRKAAVVPGVDPDDISRIAVCDGQMRFICFAQRNSTHGGNDTVSQEALKAALKRQRDYKRAVELTLRDGHMSIMPAADIARDEQDRIDADRRAERAKQGIGVENENQQLRIVRTPFDDQLEAVQRAEMRQAAGAETVNPDDEFKMPRFKPAEPPAPATDEEDDFEVRFAAPSGAECEDEEEETFDIWEGLKR